MILTKTSPNSLKAFAVLFAMMLATSFAFAQEGSMRRVALEVPQRFADLYEGIDSVSLAEPFTIEVFHAGMGRPRFMAMSPELVLHVADMDARAVIALPDRDNDGTADTSIVAADNVDSAHSIAFYDGALYVAEPTQVLRLLDGDGDGYYESRETFIGGINSGGVYDHFARTILFDQLNKNVFLGVGASCNACRETHEERGAILSFDLDGTGREVHATGLRNPIGLAIDANGALWASNADRDGLGDKLPPEIITRVAREQFFGWPFAYGAGTYVNIDSAWPEYRALLPITSTDSARVRAMRRPDFMIEAHSTPMGIAFFTNDLNEPWRAGALVAVHGSSPNGRPSGAVGYTVKSIRIDGSGNHSLHPFLEGFLTDSINYEFWGRPCGVTIDAEGNAFLSSDRGIGAIYKITYHAPSVSARIESVPRASIRALPLPSTSTVTLDYDIERGGNVSMRIYDDAGRMVATIHEGSRNTGSHRVAWRTGSRDGVYRVELVIDGVVGATCGVVVH